MLYEKLPLGRLLKGRLLRIAELQDKLMIEATSRFPVVLHGGTAIWRVYGGKRFSFDIDLYHGKPSEILEHFKKSWAFNLVRSKMTGSDVLYMRFSEGGIDVEVEVSPMFRDIPVSDGEFHLVGGDSIVIRTLSPEEMLAEKMAAFADRKKARDLYDVFFLLDMADTDTMVEELKKFARLLGNPPEDFKGLSELVLVGKAPDFGTITRKVKFYAKG